MEGVVDGSCVLLVLWPRQENAGVAAEVGPKIRKYESASKFQG